MDAQIVNAATAATVFSHKTSGLIEYLSALAVMKTGSRLAFASSGDIGYIVYADLAAVSEMLLSLSAFIETEGGHEWEYPIIIENDAGIHQVYLTETGTGTLFLDPETALAPVHMDHGVSSDMTYIVYAPMAREENYRVALSATMVSINTATWEHPVKEGDALHITQSLMARRKDQYKLEVF